MNIFQLEERLNENPNSPLAARLASQYLVRGKIGEAIKLSLSCIEQNPDYATPYIILGRCYAAIQFYKEALICANKGISLQPDAEIARNLARSWESLSSVENLKSVNPSIPELPDLDALQIILFKGLILKDVPESQESKTQEITQDIIEDEKILKDNLETGEESELEVDKNLKFQQVDSDEISNKTKLEGEQIIVEFVEQTETNLPTAIESVMQSIDFENLKAENKEELDLKDENEKFQENLVEQPEVDLIPDELKIEPDGLEQQANKEILNIEIEGSAKETVPEIESEEFKDQPEILLNSTGTTFPEKIEEPVIEADSFNASIQSSTKIEEISKSDDLQSINPDQGIVSESNLSAEDSKKSDQHITKIFESAHEATKKELPLNQTEFNHGPVPELPQIVSATLAEIYVRQGEFEEAIKTYRALIQLRPKQKEFFEKKIEELEKKLKSQI